MRSCRALLLLLPLAAAVAAGCAKSGAVGNSARRTEVEEEKPWATEEGRSKVRLEIAQTMMEAGAVDAALQIVSQAKAEGDSNPEFTLVQARGYMKQSLYAEAERALSDLQKQMPRDARIAEWLGVIYADTGRKTEAVDAFERATRLDDNSGSAWNNLGFILMSEKRYPDAIEALQHAVDLDAMQPKYRNNLGFALAASGRLPEALQLFGSTGTPADAHANLALALELGGDRAQALLHYQHALQSNPAHAAALAGMTRINASTATLELHP